MSHKNPERTRLKSKTPRFIQNQYPLIFFVFFYLLFTLFTYRDYGMTFDESGVYARGIGLAHYLVHDDFPGFVLRNATDDQDFYDHFYSTALHLLNPSGTLDQYHWLNLFFALFLFIALFELLLSQTQKPWLSLLGPIFLFLTPRFLGDIPANPKDMPFAVFYFLTLTAIYFFHRRPQTRPLVKVLILGIFFGLTQSSRIMGFTLYAVYILFDLHFYYHERRHSSKEWGSHLFNSGVLLIVIFFISNFLMVVTWPYLGGNYFNHLWQLLTLSADFAWNQKVLFLGQFIPSTQLPWYYLPLWILITTPLFVLLFAGASLILVQNKMKNELFILLACALSVNLALDLLLRPVLYDGLRHFLFLLPVIAALAALSAVHWLQRAKRNTVFKITLSALVLNAGIVGIHLFRLHPYEYAYFNELTGGLKGAQGNFETDYWGASFKEAVDWLQRHETQDSNRIYTVTGSGNSYQIFCYFKPNLRWVEMKDLKDADYYISYTRGEKDLLVDKSKVIHAVEREGVPLNYIFKLK